MEPRIQYAKTKDGVSIAFWTLGERGPALVCFPPLTWSNIDLEWEIPELRDWYERLASSRMLVRFDARGQGRSQRGVEDYSRDALMADLEAVVGRLRLERLDLLAFDGPAQMAIAFAARHTKSVSRLVLWGAQAHNRDAFGGQDRLQALLALAERDWDLAVESWTHAALGWARGQEAHQWAQYIRASIEQEDFLRIWRHIPGFDVTPLLSQVSAHTLVIEPSPSRRFSRMTHHSAVLASNIPNAQVVRLGPGSPAAYEHEEGMRAVEEFLGVEVEQAPVKAGPSPGFRTILFTDVEGSTALTQRLGDAKARELLREHERLVREALKAHGGSEVKTMGDGFMASFTSATKALESAIAMQRAFAEHNEGAEEPIIVRIGLNAGEPIAEDDDLFGTAVNRAARITATAKGSEILVANVVRELAEGKDFLFADRGEATLKGFDEPVRLFEVRWQESD
ncbi:MAG: adenylate/guanylate cyclase domain-containing protein [Gemmatimonadetes bacterium]|nr:adenylate/guanylate cyclase domain-containing protein [Gemmatimonadota bacterium]